MKRFSFLLAVLIMVIGCGSAFASDLYEPQLLSEISAMSSTAGVQHTAFRTTDMWMDSIAEHQSEAFRSEGSLFHQNVDENDVDLWVTPFYRKMSWKGNNETTGHMAGISAGVDRCVGPGARMGMALHYGKGDTESDKTITDTKNSSEAKGVSIYGSKKIKEYTITGSVGYTHYENGLKSLIPSGTIISAVPDSDTTTLGVDLKTERTFKAGDVDITPHAGIRYTRVLNDKYKTSLAYTQSDTQDIVQFPIGASFGIQHDTGNGWKLKGVLDLSVIPVAGNRIAATSVRYNNATWASYESQIVDSFSFRSSLGVMAERDYFSTNLNYAWQKSSNENDHIFRLALNWRVQ